MVGSKAAASKWTLDEVKAQIESLENVAIKRAQSILEKAPETVDTEDVLAALDLVAEVVRADFDSSEDYQDARMEAWEDFKAEVDLLEEEEDEEESEEEEDSMEEEPEPAAQVASHIQPTKYAKRPNSGPDPKEVAAAVKSTGEKLEAAAKSETPMKDYQMEVPKLVKPLAEAELVKAAKQIARGAKDAGFSKKEIEAEIKRLNAENEQLKADIEAKKAEAQLKRDKKAAKQQVREIPLTKVRIQWMDAEDTRLLEAFDQLGFTPAADGSLEVPMDIILNGLRTEYGIKIGDKVEVETKPIPGVRKARPEVVRERVSATPDRRKELGADKKAEIANRLWSARAGKYGLTIEELKSLHLRAGVAPSAAQLKDIEKARKASAKKAK